MNGVFILLGSNLGDKLNNLREAKARLQQQGFHLREQSSVYETEPWGLSDQPWFLNTLLEFGYSGDAVSALEICLKIEREMGRERIIKWGERIIDIDIIYFNDEVLELENLIIPHPGIPDRRFVLMPLLEKWPSYVHPTFQKTADQMLSETTDTLTCTKTKLEI